MSEQLSISTQYTLDEITIDGEDIRGIFVNIDIFENIFLAGVTGSITIADGDTNDFIGKNGIEFIEPITFSFRNANGDELRFEGELNGLRNEVVKKQNKIYTIDFSSKSVRMNEFSFITQKFKEVPPEDIITDMVENYLDGDLSVQGEGLPLSWVPGRRKPFEVIKYVLNHGMTIDSQSDEGGEPEAESTGTSGFLFWETLDGFRFCPITDLMGEGLFEEHMDYQTQIARRSNPIESQMKSVLSYDFPQSGDLHSKLRSGAYDSKFVSFDTDTGKYTEYEYKVDNKLITDKQKQFADKPTRYLVKTFCNEKFETSCVKAKADTGDQSRKYLAQSVARQNAMSDTQGRIVLPPQFTMRAGDHFEVKIAKMGVNSETGKTYDPKHSGRYVISQVGHHINRDGSAYTKLAVIRSTKQQDDTTSYSE